MPKKIFFFTTVLGVNKLIVGTIVIYTFFVVLLLKRTPVLLLGSMLVIATLFAMLPDAAADVDAGVGEFRLGEVLDESIGWFIVCLLYTSPSPRDLSTSRMPSSA